MQLDVNQIKAVRSSLTRKKVTFEFTSEDIKKAALDLNLTDFDSAAIANYLISQKSTNLVVPKPEPKTMSNLAATSSNADQIKAEIVTVSQALNIQLSKSDVSIIAEIAEEENKENLHTFGMSEAFELVDRYVRDKTFYVQNSLLKRAASLRAFQNQQVVTNQNQLMQQIVEIVREGDKQHIDFNTELAAQFRTAGARIKQRIEREFPGSEI
jgi:hypothetical protein